MIDPKELYEQITKRIADHDPPNRHDYRRDGNGPRYYWLTWTLHREAMKIRERKLKELRMGLLVQELARTQGDAQ